MPVLTIINENQAYAFPAENGHTLREVMSKNGFQTPYICGGRGVCGKCRVRIFDGATTISPEEKAFFSEDELNAGWRLACAARVLGDVGIYAGYTDDGFEILGFYKEVPRDKTDNFKLLKLELKAGSLTGQISDKLGLDCYSLNLIRKISGIINRDVNSLYGKTKLLALTEGDKLLDIFDFTDNLSNNSPGIYGITIDIGTTTICFELTDLINGAVISSDSRINSQRIYGADVISRIKAAGEGKLTQLRDLILKDVLSGIGRLTSQANISPRSIYRVVIAANTTMVHLLLGIPCSSLGVFPFSPTLTSGLDISFKDAFESALCDCNVLILPSVSAYVGGDIVSGLFFCGALHQKALFIDIGTNCEMAVTEPTGIICAAAAAGPAFEGGNISCGTGGVPGAVSAVRFENSQFVCETIGGAPAIGICGSGLMDAVRCMLENGMLDETGRLEDEYSSGVEIAPGVILTQKDIRELQLAKSAMRAGIEILLEAAGIGGYEGIEAVYLAGSFGYNMNIHSAAAIGMIPARLSDRVVAVGNSSLAGCARVLLEQGAYDILTESAKAASEINLSENLKFNKLFSEYMFLENV